MKKNVLQMSLVITSIIFMGLVASGCGKSGGGSGGKVTDPVVIDPGKVGIPVPNHNMKTLDMGIIESFALMAYSSITSSPTSAIKGKIGLKPGARSLIAIDVANETDGGSDNIYSGDDVGDKANYLSLAREDLIFLYKQAASRPVDPDKDEAFGGKVGGKILPPGVYKWSNGMTIDSDVTLEGNSKDIWILQVTGDVAVASGAHMILSDEAKARNVFWQVSGKVNIAENAKVYGTIMSQLNLEMKSGAKLTGRALVKNGKLILNQNHVHLPE